MNVQTSYSTPAFSFHNQIFFVLGNRVHSFASITSSIKMGTEVVPVDPESLFQRFSATLSRKDSDSLKHYFNHELAPFPTSLFTTSVSMRKCEKAKLYSYYTPVDKFLDKSNCIFVVDGGFLLRRVVWTMGQSFASIASTYINYVLKYFGRTAIVVIDGYVPCLHMKVISFPVCERSTYTFQVW